MNARRDLRTSTSISMLSDASHDAELIAICAAFCDLERAYDAPGFAHEFKSPEEHAVDQERSRIVAEQEVLADRMRELPCTTLAGVQAMATALAAWSRELLSDAPAKDLGDFLASLVVERLLALQEPGQVVGVLVPPASHPDAVRMIGGPLPVLDADLLAQRPEFDRLHALMIDYNKDLIPDGGTECADFDTLCDRIATAAPAVTAEGRAFQAAAAMHHLYYRLNEWEQGRNPAWLMLKGIAGDAYQSVGARQ